MIPVCNSFKINPILQKIACLAFITVLVTGCGNERDNDTIEGVYTAHSSHEYALYWDTLSLKAISKKGGTFLISHHSGIQRIRDGKRKTKEYKKTELVGNWYKDSRQLKTEKLGRVYSFPETGDIVFMGTVPYYKILQ